MSNDSRAVLYLNPDDFTSPKAAHSRDSLSYGVDLETGVDSERIITDVAPAGTVLSDLSVCLWLKVSYFRQTTSYVYSYATSERDNNELNFGIQFNRFLIAVGGKYLYSSNLNIYMPDSWYHICVVVNSASRTASLYLDGELDATRTLSRRHILLNGSLVLGQETDKVDGGYQRLQSFSGVITRFNLYSTILSPEDVRHAAKCSENAREGDLVSWSNADWEIFGQVSVVQLAEEDICNKNRFNFVVFSKKRKFPEYEKQCQNLKAHIALPQSAEENVALYQAAQPFEEECQPHNHATAFFWLGAQKNSEKKWVDHERQLINYTNFDKTGNRECAGYMISKYPEEWRDISCSPTYEFCAACQEEEPAIFKMRGLCESAIHATYFRMVDQPGQMLLFRGFTKYLLTYDNSGTWDLSDVWTGTTLATFSTYNDEIPFGRRTWLTTTNFDICQKSSNSSHQLTLSACYDWEYSCNDGSCINLSQRCDLRVDCPDNSDEVACEKLWKPTDYLSSLPPSGVQHGSPLQVNVSISIQGFSEINIRDMKLVVDFSMTMTWFDSRLRYKNLRHLSDLNYIETKKVWIPRVELLNADFPKIHTTDAVLNALRQSPPSEDDPSRISRDEVYEGSLNPLSLSQKFNAPFSCVMDMQNFPFDRQHCQLLIRFASAREDFMQWNDLIAKYLGEVLLAEYEVEDIDIKRGMSENYSMAIVGVTFCRRYGYYLTSAYLPTIMLMMISYVSLFCKRDNSDLRVMMALTTLLVLYALYQQIENDLPRTSYTKAIDIWCFFAITFIFSQVILHVLVDVKIKRQLPSCFCSSSKVWELEVKEKYPMSPIKSSRLSPQPGCSETSMAPESPVIEEAEHQDVCKDPKNHPLVLARIFYVVLFVTFCIIYWIVVLSNE